MLTAIGGGAAKTSKHRTRDAKEPGGLAAIRSRHASMSRGIGVRGSDRTQGVPRALDWGKRRKLQFDEGLPGADIKNTGDEARLQ